MIWLKALFGGSFGVIQAGLIGILSISAIWIWRDYDSAKKDVVRLEGEVTELTGTIASKDTVIASMGRTAVRKDTQGKQSKDLADDILKAKDGVGCSQSAPIIAALNGLRIDAAKGTPDTPNKAVPVPSGAYPASSK